MSVLWKKLLRATGLTRTGDLGEATREIQRALGHKAGDAPATPPAGRPATPRKAPSREIEARFDPPSHDREPASAHAPAEAPAHASAPAPAGASAHAPAHPRTHAPAPAPSADAASPGPAASAPTSPSPHGSHRPHAHDAQSIQEAERPPGRFEAGRAATSFGTRDFKLFSPGGDAAARRHRPLVVLLHGCKQDPDDFARGTGMNALAEQLGAYVLYPAQAQRSNAMRCWNWFQAADQTRGAGEPALIAAMVEDVVCEHAIDRDRVYVAGLSAGGAMAAILARRYPDVFAAAGIHSGLAPGAARDVASAFQAMSAPKASAAVVADPAGAPLVVFQGDADTTVHPLNARQVVASLLGMQAAPTRQDEGEPTRTGLGWTKSVFGDAAAAGPSRAELWLVHGLGHAWSGGSSSGSYTEPKGPDASREMLRFFLEHPRRAAT